MITHYNEFLYLSIIWLAGHLQSAIFITKCNLVELIITIL